MNAIISRFGIIALRAAICAAIATISFYVLNLIVTYLQFAEKGLTPMFLAYFGAALGALGLYATYGIYLNVKDAINASR